MSDDGINKAWSYSVAELAADALVTGKVISKDQYERARDIIAEETYVRLALEDRPDRTNWRYNSN